jgi:hypothetical protein
MSVKTWNAAIAAMQAENMQPSAAVAEGSLNDRETRPDTATVIEVNPGGQAIIVIQDQGPNGETLNRPVAGTDGSVRLYSNAGTAIAAARRFGVQSVTALIKAKTGTIGDPVKTLIAKHKAAVKEAASVTASKAALAAKIAGAVALHWDTAAEGTPEADEFADYQRRMQVLNEYDAAMAARVQALASSLTAAGIDPQTYMPIPAN